MKVIDLVGRSFGRLTVVARAANSPGGQLRWKCRCACGAVADVHGTNLKGGTTSSCGCLSAEMSGARGRRQLLKHGHAAQTGSPEYKSWIHAKNRCFNSNNDAFDDYGARGITMCDRWSESFEAFLEDMGHRPGGTTLDRIDNGMGYEPGNCRWATPKQQSNNRRARKAA